MPLAELRVVRVHSCIDGPRDAPWLVLSNSLGTSLEMWDGILPALTSGFRVLRYDTRGHGQSSAPPGPFTIEQLAGDVLGLLDSLAIANCHFCGLSLGGMTGIWLGIHVPERIGKLILANTAPRIGTAEGWNDRIRQARQGGMQAIVDGVIERWFTLEFRAQHADHVAAMHAMFMATPAEGYASCCAAIRDMDLRADLDRIEAPALVVAATHDPVIPVAECRALQERMRAAAYAELPASHLSVVEQPGAFAAALINFLER